MNSAESVMNHRVAVYVKGCECRVTPGHLVVEPGDAITFMPVNTDVTLLFPLFDQEAYLPTEGIRVKAAGQLSIPLDPVMPDGVYPYAVYCHANNSFAIGGSDPVIIVRKSR